MDNSQLLHRLYYVVRARVSLHNVLQVADVFFLFEAVNQFLDALLRLAFQSECGEHADGE